MSKKYKPKGTGSVDSDAEAEAEVKRRVHARRERAMGRQARYGSARALDKSAEPRSPRLSLDAVRAEEDTEYLRGSQVMKIGKYKGRTFDYISTQHFYVKWVLQQQYPSGALGQLQRYLRENRKRLHREQLEAARAAEGTLSTRTRLWNRELFVDKGYLAVVPFIGNATISETRRPRQPVHSLQEAGVVPAWDSRWTFGEKRKAKTVMALAARSLGYLFRRMVHEARAEPISEPLVADKALQVLGVNHYAYKVALKVAGGDPDAKITPEALQAALDAKRAKIRNPKKRKKIPEKFDLARVGNVEEMTPRRILMRYLLTLPLLRKAIKVYRDLSSAAFTDVVRACWVLARADGAFNWSRVSNLACPDELCQEDLTVYGFMRRTVQNRFASAPRVDYQPCLGFEGGCPLDADLVVGDTVFAVRGGLWLSTGYDGSYTQAYIALARDNGRNMKRVGLIYLQHGIEVTLDLEDWDHTSLLQFLRANDSAEAKQNNACDVGLCEDEIPKELDVDPEEKEAEKRQTRMDRRMRRQGRAAGVKKLATQYKSS